MTTKSLRNGSARVLLVNLSSGTFGGLEVHVQNLCKALVAHGHEASILAAAGSRLYRRSTEAGLPVHAARWHKLPGLRRFIPAILHRIIVSACCSRQLDVVHCNNRDEIRSTAQAVKVSNLTGIFNHHVPAHFDTSLLCGLHGFVTPSRSVANYVKEQSAKFEGTFPEARVIPPMYDAERCLRFQSSASRREWFAQEFNVLLNEAPVICSIGNMVTDLEHKNYPLLLRALAELIHRRGIAVQAVLAGDGPARHYIEQLSTDLGLREHVHFLGFVGENTPGVLHHSDAFVLASSREAFGIVFVEAGLMKRPAVGATGTGAEQIIIDGETGFLFKNSDEQSLADSIACLARDKSLSNNLGDNGFKHVQRHFSPDVILQEYLDFYACAGFRAHCVPPSLV